MYGCVALDRESVAKTPYKRRYCTDICKFYYWILYYAYLSPQQCENAGAILQLLETKGISISLRTYYVHRDEAIEVLSSILWGYTSQDCEKITNLLTPD